MRKLGMLGALAMAGAFLLSGCGDLQGEQYDKELQRGIQCYNAGGDWFIPDGMNRPMCQLIWLEDE